MRQWPKKSSDPFAVVVSADSKGTFTVRGSGVFHEKPFILNTLKAVRESNDWVIERWAARLVKGRNHWTVPDTDVAVSKLADDDHHYKVSGGGTYSERNFIKNTLKGQWDDQGKYWKIGTAALDLIGDREGWTVPPLPVVSSSSSSSPPPTPLPRPPPVPLSAPNPGRYTPTARRQRSVITPDDIRVMDEIQFSKACCDKWGGDPTQLYYFESYEPERSEMTVYDSSHGKRIVPYQRGCIVRLKR